MSENKFFEKKLVAVGDSMCGKSAVLYMLAKEQYLEVNLYISVYGIFARLIL